MILSIENDKLTQHIVLPVVLKGFQSLRHAMQQNITFGIALSLRYIHLIYNGHRCSSKQKVRCFNTFSKNIMAFLLG
jgi:hypothetical protein